ncbi:hypothetical protein [Streptomyces sp. NEAU-YJ-81]|uniref:hypothetical protein n=1 Tax=Streptomyces sp. NEAU-YJ-81 TaxID=2820288 RepID=UPI0035B3606C
MRAAVRTKFGAPLTVREIPDPGAGGGEVVVEVLSTCVPPYADEVFSGRRNYPLETPVVPGPGGGGGSSASARTPPGCASATWCGATAPSVPATTR